METTPPPSTLILLIRHGVTPTTGQILPGRTPGLHLSAAGETQAREVAQRLAGLPLSAIYTSPMERARETAVPTAELFGLEPALFDALIECEFGEWTGAKLLDLYKLPEWKTVQQTPSQFRFPGGESFPEMRERMVGALEQIASDHPGEVVAVFSHADPLKAVVSHLMGMPLDSFQRITIDTASVSVVEVSRIAGDIVGDTPPNPYRMVVSNSRTGSLGYLREG